MEDMEDLGHIVQLTAQHLSLCNKTVFLETTVDIFGGESSKELEILKVLEFLTR